MDKKRVLVVDDLESWLKTIELMLGDLYELTLTQDPDEAITLLQSSYYSLAILDQRISPEVSGVELLERLRSIQPDLRAIILTGHAGVEDAVSSMKIEGISDYISKGRRDLAAELNKVVERALLEDPPDGQLLALLQQGENTELEFKATMRWDTRLKKVNKELQRVVVRTVAAFLNSESGGVLLIGVDDDGQAIGLQPDYGTLHKSSRDGFENFLVTLLLDAYGKDLSRLLRVDFHQIEGKDVCRVSAKPSPKPVFVPDGGGVKNLYIRAGNSTRRLDAEEALEYCIMRWKWQPGAT